MKNITLSIDDELYRQARIHAAECGTSVSALVRRQLEALTSGSDDVSGLERLERDLRAMIDNFAGVDRLPRDALHRHGADGLS